MWRFCCLKPDDNGWGTLCVLAVCIMVVFFFFFLLSFWAAGENRSKRVKIGKYFLDLVLGLWNAAALTFARSPMLTPAKERTINKILPQPGWVKRRKCKRVFEGGWGSFWRVGSEALQKSAGIWGSFRMSLVYSLCWLCPCPRFREQKKKRKPLAQP